MANYLSEFLAGVAKIGGYRLLEHPDYGGVSRGHSRNSEHYKGNACDINFGAAGAPREERAKLLALIPIALDFGLNVIYSYWRVHPNKDTAANHYDHLHVDGLGLQAFPKPAPNVARARAALAALNGTAAQGGKVTIDVPNVGKVTMEKINLKKVTKDPKTWVRGPKHVDQLQGLLNATQRYNLKVDNVAGPDTRAAVLDFQKHVGLAADGVVGADTWRALLSF